MVRAVASSLIASLVTSSGAQPSEPAPPAASPAPIEAPIEARVEVLEREVERLRLRETEPPLELAVAPLVAPAAASVFNPSLAVIANGLYRWVREETDPAGPGFGLREIEIDLRAAVDPFADALVIAGFHAERPGEYHADVEEAYVALKRLPIPVLDEPPLGLKLKIGRFRTEMGRINRSHLHDLPQSVPPLMIAELLGEEGYGAEGISGQVFLPTPDQGSALELTAQALAGGGVALADGPRDRPAFVGNLRWFRTFAGAHNLELALMGHVGHTGDALRLRALTGGVDFLYKWKPLRMGEFRSFVIGGQILASRRDFEVGIDTDGDGMPDGVEERRAEPWGWFGFAQVQVARPLYLGARFDETALVDDDTARRRAASGYLTWYPSEFLRFRFGYERRIGDLGSEDPRDTILVEINFVFGSHLPEPFWVNR